MKGEIASPHWAACESCGHFGRHGCTLAHIDLSIHLGDFILCDDYLEKAEQPCAICGCVGYHKNCGTL